MCMSTHPLWRPFDPEATRLRGLTRVGSRQVPVAGVVAYDAGWVSEFEQIQSILREVLGRRAMSIEHVGSTSIPGLAAKPIIDLDLVVADSTDEVAYVPSLEAAGFRLIAREPDWEEHRCMTFSDPNSNVHVFSPGAIEPMRHRVFRDWLVAHQEDRAAYADLKLGVARQGFGLGDYNGSKAGFVYDIYEKAFSRDASHRHDPHTR
ncbi:MAG TPA: hypothetical protein DCP11_09865 [Microbacteriaceae bacterium]|nr:hypothetical protein [Microbacteriaceae bacterium]